jgi:hypothetical protein
MNDTSRALDFTPRDARRLADRWRDSEFGLDTKLAA